MNRRSELSRLLFQSTNSLIESPYLFPLLLLLLVAPQGRVATAATRQIRGRLEQLRIEVFQNDSGATVQHLQLKPNKL